MYIDRYSYVYDHVFCIRICISIDIHMYMYIVFVYEQDRRDRYLHMCIWYLYINRTLVSVDGSVIDNRFYDCVFLYSMNKQTHTKEKTKNANSRHKIYVSCLRKFACTNTHTRAHIYVCVYIHIYLCINLYPCKYLYLYMSLHICVYIYIYIYICVNVYIDIDIYLYLYIHRSMYILNIYAISTNLSAPQKL